MNISDLPKSAYVYRYKQIILNGHSGTSAPQRKDNELDNWDRVFDSKEEYERWHHSLTVGLAELDQCMNFCYYFHRVKNNEGNYIREGKSFPVIGTWCGLHDFCFNEPEKGYKPTIDFVKFLKENGWENNWFKLMDRYTMKL